MNPGITITGISSMATRAVLAELTAAFESSTGHQVHIESVGGVDAAKRVQAGEDFDVVLLAADAIDKLMASGHVQAASRVDLFKSPVAVAVALGAPQPNISAEEHLKAAVLAASSISFSTGPSGVYLTNLFERWGISSQVHSRMVQAPPGVPVASLIASGQVQLGFQQLSELMNVSGVAVLGLLPGRAAYITTFSAARGLKLAGNTEKTKAVDALLAYLNSSAAASTKQQHGMQSA